jgi:hypothetical protein
LTGRSIAYCFINVLLQRKRIHLLNTPYTFSHNECGEHKSSQRTVQSSSGLIICFIHIPSFSQISVQPELSSCHLHRITRLPRPQSSVPLFLASHLQNGSQLSTRATPLRCIPFTVIGQVGTATSLYRRSPHSVVTSVRNVTSALGSLVSLLGSHAASKMYYCPKWETLRRTVTFRHEKLDGRVRKTLDICAGKPGSTIHWYIKLMWSVRTTMGMRGSWDSGQLFYVKVFSQCLRSTRST